MTRHSLIERAAEIYDFASGAQLDPLRDDLPPPRPRLQPAEPAPPVFPPAQAAPRPAAQRPETAPPASPLSPETPPRRPLPAHGFAEVDQAALARAGYLLVGDEQNALAEEMRLVKRRLLARVETETARGNDRARIILIASGQPGEGKTFTAINLALSLAHEQDRAVLLVDGDTAKPEALDRLGVTAGPGLVDALAEPSLDPEALVIDTDLPGLSLLPAGRKERNVPELLASARTETVIERLLEADPQRIVVIDSPPALAASTAGALAALVGQTLVVVRADITKEADLRETLDLLSGCDQLALLLNAAGFSLGGRRFGRYEEYR
jgi:protein-tyrosine kinase